MTELLAALFGLALAQGLAVMSPGPSFVVVARTALTQSSAAALWVTAGLGAGTALWAGAALFGLGLLFETLPSLYLAVRVGGALFLLWLALKLWRGAAAGDTDPAPTRNDASENLSAPRAFRLGLATQLANPKVVIFFGSVFVAFLPPSPTASFQFAALAVAVVIELLWYGIVSIALRRERLRHAYARAGATLDRVTGVVLAALGVRLLLPD